MAIQNQQELDFEKQLVHYKATIDSGLEAWKATEATHLTSFKATLDFGQSATKASFLLNGAGALALLAFMGSNRAPEHQHLLPVLAAALATFAAGAMAAVLCMGCAYVAQALFTMAARKGYRSRWFWAGTFFQGLGLAVGIVSVWVFFAGLQRSAGAFAPGFSIWSVLF
jgi:hypothetical protein